MTNFTDTLKSILVLAKTGADADESEVMREHLLAIAELARKALQNGQPEP